MTLTNQELKDFKELTRLHDVAFNDYLDRHDRGHKSSDGAVTLYFGNFWDREGFDIPGNSKLEGVEVYSYALSPTGRMHYFKTMREALEAVRGWYEVQMSSL